MNMIELTSKDDTKIIANVNNITYIRPYIELDTVTGSLVSFTGEDYVLVNETVAQIKTLMEVK